jgi:hypothetical protein
MQLTGKIIAIFPAQTVGENFIKRDFVIHTDADQYPQEIIVQLTGDKVNLLDSLKIGDAVTASINIRGRSWQPKEGPLKWFNTIQAWALVMAGVNYTHNQTKPEGNGPDWIKAQEERKNEITKPVEDDDLPF